MTLRRTRAVSLFWIASACVALLYSASRRPVQENLTDEQAAVGRWIAIGDRKAESESQLPLSVISNSRTVRVSPTGLDRLIQELEALVLEDSKNAYAHSNLACALIMRGRQRNRPIDLIEASEQLELASDVQPNRPEILYNRALVLTFLRLRVAAQLAWGRFLESEPISPWSSVAKRRITELQTPTLFQRWESSDRERLLLAAEHNDLAVSKELVAAYPTFARQWIEERFLPEWAEAEQSSDTAERVRRTTALHVFSEAIAESIHDHTVEDTLQSDRMSGLRRAPFLEGIHLFGHALSAYRDFGSKEDANVCLQKAARALRHLCPSLSRWALFYRSVGWHRTSPSVALSQLLKLSEVTPLDRQPSLAARIEWMLGTNEETQNRYELALNHYKLSKERLLLSEGPQAADFLDLLIAEVLGKLGELEEGWTSRLTAINGLVAIGDRQRLHAGLYSTVEQLLSEHRFEAARAWIVELEANASLWGTAPGLAEAALQKGRLLSREGRRMQAEESFHRARAAAARIGDSGLRSRTVATIELYEAEGLIDKEPKVAKQELERGRPAMLKIGYRFQLPRLDSDRARASLGMGDRKGALAALRSSIDEEETIRRDVRDESMRASAFEGAQQAFDTLVELELRSQGGDPLAFRYAERSRARVLLDLIADQGAHPSLSKNPVGLVRLMSELSMGTDLLEFAVLPEKLVLWRVRRGESRRFETKILASDLEMIVEKFCADIIQNRSAASIRARSRKLWGILLAPMSGELAANRRLIIVPDRFLGRVPFASLLDPGSQRYLLEDHQIIVTPSASAFLLAEARIRTLGSGSPSSVLAIGANSPGETWLPTVESEAASIGSLYPESHVFTGKTATRSSFSRVIKQVQVVHFAGHAKDDAVAARRSRILFYPEDQTDSGFLFSEDIAAERFPKTRLAVIAACRSVNSGSRGREVVSGIAAAFLAAGVPTVVASLWDIEDKATDQIMIAFHKNICRHLAPAEALRLAQIEMLRSGSPLSAVRYWGGFVVVGAG
jgi:CHAT domain-containing protein/tetratricopeptide (TPR) repeat protein